MKRAKKVVPDENYCDRVISEYRYGLDADQQAFLKKNAHRKDLVMLMRECYDSVTLDEYSEEFQNVKKFLLKVSRGADNFNFNSDQVRFIEDNGPTMRPIDIARALFPGAAGSLIREAQTIGLYCIAKDIQYVEVADNEHIEASGEYEPPHSDHKIIAKINAADGNAKYHISGLDPRKKECIAGLKKNLHSPRFVLMANSIKRLKLREFFEMEFIRAVYDKPDLNADETNAYISLCKAYVDEMIILEIIYGLNDRLTEVITDDDTGKKFATGLSEALKAKTTEAKECRAFIHQSQKSLSGSRADRIKDLTALNQSLAKFVQLAEDERGRARYLRAQQARLEEIKAEVEVLTQAPDIIAEIYGTSIEELLKF